MYYLFDLDAEGTESKILASSHSLHNVRVVAKKFYRSGGLRIYYLESVDCGVMVEVGPKTKRS